MQIGKKDIIWLEFPMDDRTYTVFKVDTGIPVEIPQEMGVEVEGETHEPTSFKSSQV